MNARSTADGADATIVGGADGLSLAAVGRVAAGGAVRLAPDAVARLDAGVRQLHQLAAAGRVVYGLTTGCGPLADRPIPDADRTAFRRNLVRSHASGLGPAHPVRHVRATLLLRAASLAQGRSAVRPVVVETLLAMLAADLLPVIPEVGSVGASGDLVELAHVALGLTGEGEVFFDGRRMPAADGFRAASLTPLVLDGREALALMNGTSCETAQAALLVLDAEELVAAAEAAAATIIDVLGGSAEAFDARVHAVRPHPGQQASAAHLRDLLAGSTRLRDTARRGDHRGMPAGTIVQDAYTLRCVPQVLGAVRDTLAHVRRVIEIECNSVTDNPTFFPEDDLLLHAGNFHGQPVAMAVDHLKVAIAEIALFSERRLARVLDPALNGGLPAFLIRRDAGIRSGLMGLQYAASSTVADNSVLAHPTTLGSVSTNANNQDVVGMGSVGVRQARRLLDNARRVVAIELVAAAEAVEVAGPDGLGRGTRATYDWIRSHVAPLDDDRPLGADVERVVDHLGRLATLTS